MNLVWVRNLINLGPMSVEPCQSRAYQGRAWWVWNIRQTWLIWAYERRALSILGLSGSRLMNLKHSAHWINLGLWASNLVYLGCMSVELEQSGAYERRSWSVLCPCVSNLVNDRRMFIALDGFFKRMSSEPEETERILTNFRLLRVDLDSTCAYEQRTYQ